MIMFRRRQTDPNVEPTNEFMECVQMHERAWGIEMYPGKPPLEKIMSAPVVVFWKSRDSRKNRDGLWMITLHKDMAALESHMTSMLFRSVVKPVDKFAVRIFNQQRRVVLAGVRFLFKEVE
jgi:hypothetical protein